MTNKIDVTPTPPTKRLKYPPMKIGEQYQYYTIIELFVEVRHNNDWRHLCRCICGKTVSVKQTSLRRGSARSCGCRKPEIATTHGMNQEKIYQIWSSIIQRCTNPKNRGYKNYGGRGIQVSEEWKKFENFFRDVGDQPPGLTLDRIDNDKGYSKENCRWVSWETQAVNRRNTIYTNVLGEKLPLKTISKVTNISADRLKRRLKNHKTIFCGDIEPNKVLLDVKAYLSKSSHIEESEL